MVTPADVGQMVRVADDHGPYSGEVAVLGDFQRHNRWSLAYIKFEDGTGSWVSAKRLTTDEKAHPLTRPREV